MRLRAGLWVLGALLLLAGGAEAGIFGGTKKLPKPIDSPILRPKVQEGHKAGKRHRHVGTASVTRATVHANA